MKTLKNIIFAVGFVWKRSKYSIFILVAQAMLVPLISIMNVWGFRYIIFTIENRQGIKQFFFALIVFMALHILCDFLDGIYRKLLLPQSTIRINRAIHFELMQKASKLDIKCFDDADFYNKYTKALSEANSRLISILNSIANFVGSFLSVAALVGMIAAVQPIMTIFALISVALSFWISLYKNKAEYNVNNELTPSKRRKSYVSRVLCQKEFSEEIRQFPKLAPILMNEYMESTWQEYKTIKKFAGKLTMFEILHGLVGELPVVVSMIYMGLGALGGRITLTDFTTAYNAVENLTMQLSAFIHSLSGFNSHALYIDNLKTILDYQAEIEESGSEIKLKFKKEILFKNVFFQYPGNGCEVLKNIDLTIAAGEKIALVGYNGAGKSTLVKLLIRLYDSTAGSIRVDGFDVRQVDVAEWRRNFGMVFQKYQVYAVSVAENVLMRKMESLEDEEKVISALKKVGLYDIVLKSPKGIHTIVTKEFDNDGLVFSGGQVQKLALARIYASDTRIVILDEPSASLDPYAEYELNQEIQKMDSGKTVIVISHRLSCTSMMDKIYFMEDGQISEWGTHSQLMERGGKYATVYNIQKRSYDSGLAGDKGLW